MHTTQAAQLRVSLESGDTQGMNARSLLAFMCFLAACRHGEPSHSVAPKRNDCQSPEQLAVAARQTGPVLDETSVRKFADGALLLLIERIAERAERIRSTGVETSPTGGCIPKRIFILVTFTGHEADLMAMGVGFSNIVPGESENDFAIGEGYIDPTRLVELAAIPHVLGIRGAPEVQPVLE
jgi:hypothetical protein